MGDLIDLSLLQASRRLLNHMLDTRGINYFIDADAKRPFQLEPAKVERLVRTASKMASISTSHQRAVEHVRTEIRKELIRRVVAEMLQLGL